MKKWHKVLIIVAAVIAALVVAGICLWNYLFGGLKHVQIDANELGIEEIDENGVYSWYKDISSDSTSDNQSNTDESENGAGTKTISAEDNKDGSETEINSSANDEQVVSSDDTNDEGAETTPSGTDAADNTEEYENTNDVNQNSVTTGESENDDNYTSDGAQSEINGDADKNSGTNAQDNAAVSDEQTGTSTESSQTSEKHAIINIAIFGMSVSQVYGIDTDRSDMNLIVSIDQDNNRICLTSILRDSKVPIEGHDPQKINAAYKYGGATLAIKTINQNFHMNIADYITVNFESLLEIVDYFGGVEVELTEAEAEYMGGGLTAGKQVLDGTAALKYASIRYIDSDFYRASRQQTIVLALLQKVAQLPKASYPEAINKLMGTLESSMTANELLALIDCIDISTLKVVTNTIPDKEYETDLWGGIDSTGSWVYEYDLEEAAKRIHRIIYSGSEHGEEETSTVQN